EDERDVVVNARERIVVPHREARQMKRSLSLVSRVQLRVENGVDTDQAFVHVRPGVQFLMVMKPQERLLLIVVAARRPVHIHVVDELAWRVTAYPRVRVAIALRRRMGVVKVDEKPALRMPEGGG